MPEPPRALAAPPPAPAGLVVPAPHDLGHAAADLDDPVLEWAREQRRALALVDHERATQRAGEPERVRAGGLVLVDAVVGGEHAAPHQSRVLVLPGPAADRAPALGRALERIDLLGTVEPAVREPRSPLGPAGDERQLALLPCSHLPGGRAQMGDG